MKVLNIFLEFTRTWFFKPLKHGHFLNKLQIWLLESELSIKHSEHLSPPHLGMVSFEQFVHFFRGPCTIS